MEEVRNRRFDQRKTCPNTYLQRMIKGFLLVSKKKKAKKVPVTVNTRDQEK